MLDTLLGGLSPEDFLKDYWQKRPLLVRNALPGFEGLLSRDELLDLSTDEDAESRFVCHDGTHWDVAHGPLDPVQFKRKAPWTVLVQGVNLFLPEADRLLHSFDFIPKARLDDLMVSYARDGGGVGPHFDHYDVFLIQGMGQRRWRLSDQSDRTLVEGAPLRILQHFEPTIDWLLAPGDLLYLPPHWAHDGIAVGECMTYSVGFRTPTANELAHQFLGWLADHVALDAVYRDPDLTRPEHPGLLDDAMVGRVAQMLAGIRWDTDDIRTFLGSYLTEPKPHVFFDDPDELPTAAQFRRLACTRGVVLDGRTLLLFDEHAIYLNGETCQPSDALRPAIIMLADRRCLYPHQLADASDALFNWLHEQFEHGFLHLGAEDT